MQYAFDLSTDERIEPFPGARALCPSCKADVIAKCGDINSWHWAHVSTDDCDTWSEGETLWHREWKEYFKPEECEVVMGNHRADIRTSAGRVIELQHSPISTTEIEERERFYGRGIVWVVDASGFIENMDFRKKVDHSTFRWKWPRKTWASASRPVYLDPGEESGWGQYIFRLNKMYGETPCGGWGKWGCKFDFLRYFGVCIPTPAERRALLAQHYEGRV